MLAGSKHGRDWELCCVKVACLQVAAAVGELGQLSCFVKKRGKLKKRALHVCTCTVWGVNERATWYACKLGGPVHGGEANPG